MATKNMFDFRFEPTFVSPTRKQFLPGYNDKSKHNKFAEQIKKLDEPKDAENYIVQFRQLTLNQGEPLPIYLPDFKEIPPKPAGAPAKPCRFSHCIPP